MLQSLLLLVPGFMPGTLSDMPRPAPLVVVVPHANERVKLPDMRIVTPMFLLEKLGKLVQKPK